MKVCENTKCDRPITVPSLDLPGQCYQCAEITRERTRYAMEVLWVRANGKKDESDKR